LLRSADLRPTASAERVTPAVGPAPASAAPVPKDLARISDAEFAASRRAKPQAPAELPKIKAAPVKPAGEVVALTADNYQQTVYEGGKPAKTETKG
jgi:hypothetical protein